MSLVIDEVPTKNTFSQTDLDAVKDILDSLQVPWWLTTQYHHALATAYAKGKTASSVNLREE